MPARATATRRIVAACLLSIIVIFGGWLRFTGQNWDDYSHTHPDERFLTALLLPVVGGRNEYTHDDERFPRLSVLAPADEQSIQQTSDLWNATNLRIGARRDSFAAEAGGWLSQGNSLLVFDDARQAIDALRQGQIDIALAQRGEALEQDNARVVVTLDSRQLQEWRCRHLYPHSDGAGPYFDARCSPLNPHQAGHGFYVYGTFPLFLAHFASEFVRDAAAAGSALFSWQGHHLVWRALSAVFDIVTIVIIFALGSRLQGRGVGLMAALFYAAAPLAIQKAHFGTTNAIAASLVALALYFAVVVQQRGTWRAYIFFGLACGAAVASRLNLAPLAGIVVVAGLIQAAPGFDNRLSRELRSRIALRVVIGLILAGIATFVTFRILNPYTFIGPGFFDILPNERWLENASSGSYGVSGMQDAPPNWQWLSRAAYIYPLKDMLLWAMGPPLALLAWLGWGWAGWRIVKLRRDALLLLPLVVWTGGYFLWMNQVWPMTMRYYLPLYSALMVLAAWAISRLHHIARETGKDAPLAKLLLLGLGALFFVVGAVQLASGRVDATALTALAIGIALPMAGALPLLRRKKALLLGAFALGFTCLWGLMAGNVYRKQTTLIQGSRYLFERVPGDFAMRIDGADHATPLINLAFPSNPLLSASLSGGLYNHVTTYMPSVPQSKVFTPRASGTVHSVYAPHLADPFDEPGAERLTIRVFDGTDNLLGEAVLEEDLSRETHPLGKSYEIPFDTAIEVAAGEAYRFEVRNTGARDLIGSGSVVLTEGDWDNRVTGILTCQPWRGNSLADKAPSGMYGERDCFGEFAFSALVNSQDQIMSFPVDDQRKYESLIESLTQGDYLTIASNRFYDTEPRNPLRFPLTTLYYEKLFNGELGYDLVAVFDESFELGPWRVSDQHLPIYQSPAWLNELEADEAFHVYDHPAVFIFQKSAEFSVARVRAALSSASLRQAHELGDNSAEAQLLGVVYWSSYDADSAPTGLTFPAADQAVQSAGGTWPERFFSDSLANRQQALGTVFWYLSLLAMGIVAFPIVFALCPRLADGGYGVSKITGLLALAFLAWAGATLKLPFWTQAGLLVLLLLLALLSVTLSWRNRALLRDFVRENWKRLAWIELITVAAFAFMVFVRLTNPDLWHPYKGGEKPMDFAYLNGVLRSTTFPPLDPWFAGGFINYYYFGYVLVGVPALLLGIVPAFAYNLMIPTVFCLTGIGAFSAAFNISCRWRNCRAGNSEGRGGAWRAGLLAMMMCVLLGNLDTARVVGLGVAQLGGYAKPDGLATYLVDEYVRTNGAMPEDETRRQLLERAAQSGLLDNLRYEAQHSVSLIGGLLRGAGRVIAGESLPLRHDRWYWGPSRVLAETPGVGGNAITEMPYFTFLYGDLHAHMIDMPLILLTIAFVFSEICQARDDRRRGLERFLALAWGAMAVGLTRATNTWDWPTMTLLAVAGLLYCWRQRWNFSVRGVLDWRFHTQMLGALCLVIAALTLGLGAPLPTIAGLPVALAEILDAARRALLLFAGALLLWIALRHFLTRASTLDLAARVGGFIALNFAFALPFTTWYASEYNSIDLWRGGKTPLWAYLDIHGLFLFIAVSLLIWETSNWLRATRVARLRGRSRELKLGGFAAAAVGLLALGLTLAHYQAALLVLPITVWIGVLFFRPDQSDAMRFLLVLIGLALCLTLGVEIIVLGGDIGRQNTVFKFYIQVWLLLSVACGVGASRLIDAAADWRRSTQIAFYAPCILLFALAASFPVVATRARSLDRMAPGLGFTLNGMDFMQESTHFESAPDKASQTMLDLSIDHALIRWMQENISGSPVIMEGRRYPSEYQWNGRISSATGLPSVVGWGWHQRQQRMIQPLPRWVEQREQNVRNFYETENIDIAVDIINHFDIKYIVSGQLEALHGGPAGMEKFDRMVDSGLLSVAYAIDGGTIYAVDEDALQAYLAERYR